MRKIGHKDAILDWDSAGYHNSSFHSIKIYTLPIDRTYYCRYENYQIPQRHQTPRHKIFTSQNHKVSTYANFPIVDNTITALGDANWGPQDQSTPQAKITKQLDLFKPRSIPGHIVWLNGPLHWVSKRQTYTTRSSAEAEIYATDECAEQILHFSLVLQDLNSKIIFMSSPTPI